MNISDLMIGDVLLVNNVPQKVVLVDDHLHYKIITKGKDRSYVGDLEYVKPIPLSKETLEKIGFVEINENVFKLDLNNGIYIYVDLIIKDPFVAIHNYEHYSCPICHYLHELQHAALTCGIKLDIDLNKLQ